MQDIQLSEAATGIPQVVEPETSDVPRPDRAEDPGVPSLEALHHKERLTTEPIPIDQLAQLDYDKSLFFFGIVPIFAVGSLFLVFIALYFYRRGKQWNEIGEAMRLEDDAPNPVRPSGFDTNELVHLAPTRPAAPLPPSDHGADKNA